ncbi:MAG: ribosome small subunit-dependent GTPase A [Flavobacteriales bacterium]|nr:ribosome small subunit-dependent GTPase A [Flavobacteriales bacterium]
MENDLNKGVVLKSTGSWYQVRNEKGQTIQCRVKGKLRLKDIRSTNPVAVGDKVFFSLEEDGNGIIEKIGNRENYIIRRSTNLSKETHIIAANIDQAFLIVTLQEPFTTTGFIDRFLVTAAAYHIPTVILFNKLDVYDDKADGRLVEYLETYNDAGYECIQMSALKKKGLEKVIERMKDKTTLLSGHSGVGKTTFINAIQPGLDLKTSEVSQLYKQGKHTTTFAEMFPLAMGGFIIDTPGIRSFGVYDIEKKEISHYFPEMLELIDQCKFSDCMHISEPQCAVRQAFERNEIPFTRYKNYLEICNDDKGPYRVDIYAE